LFKEMNVTRTLIILLTCLASGTAVVCCGDDGAGTDGGADTDTDIDGGMDGGAQLDCDDLVPCTGLDGGVGFECVGEPETHCWNMTTFCSEEYLCATFEQACLVACNTEDCISLDTDPTMPSCD
jgi:hypothetical protein